MNVILPVSSKEIECIVEIYITEAVLVGDIPHTYIVGSGSAGLLNFYRFLIKYFINIK